MNHIYTDDEFLIELLMDANRKANGWQNFLEAFQLHFNLHSCHLYIENNNTLSPCFQYWAGVDKDEAAKQDYIEKRFINDLSDSEIFDSELSGWFASNLNVGFGEANTPTVLSKYGIDYVCGSMIFREGPWSCAFIHTRSSEQGGYLESEVERFSALSIYIEKAIKLRIYLSDNTNNKSRLKAILNQFHLPVATLNEFGEVVAQNRLMDVFLEQQSYLSKSQGKYFLINNDSINKKLQVNIRETIYFAKNNIHGYLNDSIIINPTDDSPYILGLQELIERDDDTGEVFVGALVFTASSVLISKASKQQIQSLFSLTNAESQVAYLFSQYMNLKEVARHESKSIATVREQIQLCFKKTKTKSQLELINLLSSLPISE